MGTWALGHSTLEGHFDTQGTQGTQGTWALGHSRHSRHSGTRALKPLGHLRHSETRRALGHSGTQGTWTLGHSGSWALERHLGTRALNALYLADSISVDLYKMFVKLKHFQFKLLKSYPKRVKKME